MLSSLKHDAWIQPAEDFAPPGAELPRRLFHCRLDDQPDHLVPQRYLRDWDCASEDLSDRPLFINPDCCFARDGQLPSIIAASTELLGNFASLENTVWIHDPVRQTVLPFWLGPEFTAALAAFKPGDRAPSGLTSEARHILTMAAILVADSHDAANSRQWSAAMAGSAAEFSAKRYAPVAQLIHPFHLSALRRYYRYLIRQGELTLGDSQSPRRYAMQNEAVACFFHRQLTPAVSAVVQEAVKPSYVYLGAYLGGAELEAHIDREQCEFSVSLCIDYSPEPLLATPWPLHLDTSSGRTAVFQGIGDALVYCGRELMHSRRRLPLGHSSTSLFFHYVRENFSGPLT